MKFQTLMQASILKTLYFNIKYEGIKGILKPKFLISKNTVLRCLKGKIVSNTNELFSIKIGFGDVRIFDNKYERTLIDNRGIIKFSEKAFIGTGTRISNSGEIIFGKNFNVTDHSSFICNKKIKFENDCLISWNCSLLDTDFHKIFNQKLERVNENKEIYIGNNCWISSGTTILKGSYIPDNCIIAANSTITKRLNKNNALYVSNDLKKQQITWKY